MARRRVGPPGDALVVARPARVLMPPVAIAELAKRGVDLAQLAAELGVPAPPAALSPAEADRLLAAALARAGDPAFALHAASRSDLAMADPIGLVLLAAPTLGDAIRRAARYIRVFGGGTFELVSSRAGDARSRAIAVRRRSFVDLAPAVEPAHVDFDLALVAGLARLAEPRATPRSATLRAPVAAQAEAYTRAFGVAPQFAAAHDELVFAASDLARPLRSANAELDAYFIERAERLLAECDVAPVLERVRTAVRALLADAPPTLADVARVLGTSERTLQRQLGELATSFAELLDAIRRTVVRDALAGTELALAEIARRAGFASTASLHRAFRRWERVTPAAFRARARATRS